MNQLLRKIEQFDIDGGPVKLTFPRRLARENGWTVSFSNRVVDEYKRFVYLAMVAGHPVTPSEHVDQAWHLHLTYTKSYWERLNGEILPRPLHHNPTQGGNAENDKFADWYRKTLASYEEIFGATPPGEIWPAPEMRFGHDLAWKRVNTSDNWVIPKFRARYLGLVVAAAVVGGCAANEGTYLAVLVLIGVVIIIALITAFSANRREANRGVSGCGSYVGGGYGGSTSSSDDGEGDGGGGDGGGCGGGGCGGGCGG